MTTPGVLQGSRLERLDSEAGTLRMDAFPSPLRSPHIIVIDGDLAELERTGRLLSGRGFGITLSATLLDESTYAFLTPALVIVDLTTVLPMEARRRGERHVLDTLVRDDVPVVLCRSGLYRGQGSGRPGVATLAKPFQPADLLPAVEALLYWRTEQQRFRSLRHSAPVVIAPVAGEPA